MIEVHTYLLQVLSATLDFFTCTRTTSVLNPVKQTGLCNHFFSTTGYFPNKIPVNFPQINYSVVEAAPNAGNHRASMRFISRMPSFYLKNSN
jgi:hypothetical protein